MGLTNAYTNICTILPCYKRNVRCNSIAICGPHLFKFFNSSLLWDVFIINSVEQLQTLPKTQSEIDISPFLKTQNPRSSTLVQCKGS